MCPRDTPAERNNRQPHDYLSRPHIPWMNCMECTFPRSWSSLRKVMKGFEELRKEEKKIQDWEGRTDSLRGRDC